jgi:hypothetical protein
LAVTAAREVVAETEECLALRSPSRSCVAAVLDKTATDPRTAPKGTVVVRCCWSLESALTYAAGSWPEERVVKAARTAGLAAAVVVQEV